MPAVHAESTPTDAPPLPTGDVSVLAERAYSRTTGADAIRGNAVDLLIDARENFPAWLDAIRAAERQILFEMYIVDDDEIGRVFANALAERARAGVRVKVLIDWLGGWRGASVWNALAGTGAEVRYFNPPGFASPLAWLARDHRKTITVDDRVGFVSGLCVSRLWQGNPAKRREPWRDTGIAVHGPAVGALQRAFALVWDVAGDALTPECFCEPSSLPHVGDVTLRVVAGTPNAAGTYRLDLTIASVAHEYLWLTDAYFVGTAAYVQALAAAARDGVDVRLLVPGVSDIPLISPVSRVAYKPLLDAGVRVFEWDGTMLHAKTAVADGIWARVGSTNLNLASWMGNYELDVAIEDRAFAQRMAAQYAADLEHSTEIVLTKRHRVRKAEDAEPVEAKRAASGSAGRVAAGAVSVGSALSAALTNRRPLGAAEAGLLVKMAVLALILAVLTALWPRVVAWPLGFIAAWFGVAWLVKAAVLRRSLPPEPPAEPSPRSGRKDE
ncbi:MAG: phosphatidylserine/phosphatidylglycerophosphate/cardiolipin synthase family protein [Burkholderiales bacterium]|nr:phosphatidylserine/phosphatidylglycerophosphate/cardiolipin synthase family protein [Burkholderiales bacterium]MCE7877761.1 phosphatidylserine/phosphatidylglycerophosphate/cardiolipin synthase family protein [Betaproteobacteria bacterium PRO3]